jgi:hypothetical protein
LARTDARHRLNVGVDLQQRRGGGDGGSGGGGRGRRTLPRSSPDLNRILALLVMNAAYVSAFTAALDASRRNRGACADAGATGQESAPISTEQAIQVVAIHPQMA